MRRVVGERIESFETHRIEDARVGLELGYNEGNKIIFGHILWSALVFLIALLI